MNRARYLTPVANHNAAPPSRPRRNEARRDARPVTAHLKRLLAAGNYVKVKEIAAAAGLGASTVSRIARGGCGEVGADIATAILSLTPDDVIGAWTNSAGLHRRILTLGLHGWPTPDIAAMLGVPPSHVDRWLAVDLVKLCWHTAVADLYDQMVSRAGPSPAAAAAARAAGALPARCWAPDTIDDPSYSPLDRADRIGVRRRLRAMAVGAQGAAEVAARCGEAVETIEMWTWHDGGLIPAYAVPMIKAVYRQLAVVPGPNQPAADAAREQGWVSALGWEGNIDDPRARPCLTARPPRSNTDVLDSMIYNALDGVVTRADLTRAELIQVVTILHWRGWSDRRIAIWLNWGNGLDLRYDAQLVWTFRDSNGIKGAKTVPAAEEESRGLLYRGAA